VWDRVGLAPLPAGPAGVRAAYAGCHSFAVAATASHREGAVALLRWLTSFEAQLGEARLGAIPCRASALRRVREEAVGDPSLTERWQLLAEAEETMIIPPRFSEYPKCENAIWQSIQKAMEGVWTPRKAVQRAAAAILPIVGAHVAVES
jgi:multiple sugar transport system substrate-binding protein